MAAGWFLSEFRVTVLQAFFFFFPLPLPSPHILSSAAGGRSTLINNQSWSACVYCTCASYSICQHVCNVCQCVCVFSTAEEVTTPCFQSVGETRWRRCSTWLNAHYLLHQRSFLESYTWDVFINHSAEIAGALLSTVSWLPLRGSGIGKDPAFSLFSCLFSFFFFFTQCLYHLPNCMLFCLHLGVFVFTFSAWFVCAYVLPDSD